MASLQPPSSLSPAALNFIKHHTEIDLECSTLEECPICLEAYTSTAEQAIRIRGVPGCTHSLGLDCLKRMLCSNPQQEKRCPLCRTEWLTGTPRLDSLTAAIRAFEEQIVVSNGSRRAARADREAGITAALLEPQGRAGSTNIGSAIDQIPFPIPRFSFAEQAADVAAYRAELENYNGFRRDIQNIRNRASGTQPRLPRTVTRNRESSSRFLSAMRAVNQTGSNRTFTTRSNSTPGQSFSGLQRGELSRRAPFQQQALPQTNNSITQRSPVISEPESTMLLDSLASSSSPSPPSQQSSPAHLQPNFPWSFISSSNPTPRPQPTNSQPHLSNPQTGRRVRMGSTFGTRMDQPDANSQALEDLNSDASENAPSPTSSSRSAGLSEQEENIRQRIAELNRLSEALHAQRTGLASLQADMTSREQLITVRERELAAREAQASARENAVLLREQRLESQQQRLDQVANLIVGHADESRAMLGRQQEEVTRAFGEGGGVR